MVLDRQYTRRAGPRSLAAGLAFFGLCTACAASQPAGPQAMVAESRPTSTPAALSLPESWQKQERDFGTVVRAMSLDALEERWEDTPSGCTHVYVVQTADRRVDSEFGNACRALRFGPVDVHVFKLPTRMSCRAPGAALRAELPWDRLVLAREVAQSCSTMQPTWVREEIRDVAPMVGEALPVAASWKHGRSGQGVRTEWELEWAPQQVDQSTIEQRLDALSYQLSDQASYRLWTRRRPGTHSYTFARAGYRDNRLIVSRWRYDVR